MFRFIPPWANNGDPARYPGTFLERHSAKCRALGVKDQTSPFDVGKMLRELGDDERLAIIAKADAAAEQYLNMVAWNPPDAEPVDMNDLRLELLSDTFDHACLWGGRGGGKSHIVAEVIIELASTNKERVVCSREFQNSTADSVRDLMVEKIKASRWANEWTCLETELRNEVTGSKITFLGLARNPTAQKSMAGVTIVWVEEAADVTQGSIDVMVPTVMREATSRIFWTYNPKDEDTPVEQMFRKGEPPERSIVRSVQPETNPYFYCGKMPAERRTSYRTHSQEKYRHIWRGGLEVNSERLVYRNWSVGRVDVPLGLEPRYGLDWGWTDPLACLEIFVIEPQHLNLDPEEHRGIIYICRELYGSHIASRSIPSKLDEMVPNARNGHITADSSEPKSIKELEMAGFSVAGAVKGPGSVRAGISLIQGYDIVVSPDCPNIQSEFSSYVWKVNKAGVVLKDPVDAFNHACDALRYGLEDYVPPAFDNIAWV